MQKKRGFTLIESLAVISIIGTLASLTTYVILQAQRQSRDAKRKSDITAISEGFEARYADQTCSTSSAVNHFPGQNSLDTDPSDSTKYLWGTVGSLTNDQLCGNFVKNYLPTIPEDPQKTSQGRDYYFNITKDFKHYRLTAALERRLSVSEVAELAKQSQVWSRSFKGQAYDEFNDDGSCRTNNVDSLHPNICYSHYQGR